MIKAKLIDSQATLNDFFEITSLSFIPGENLTINIRIYDAQKEFADGEPLRMIPPLAATLNMTFTDNDGADVVRAASLIDADDRSMWTVALSQADTLDLGSSLIRIDLDVNGDTTVICKTSLKNVLIQNILTGDC